MLRHCKICDTKKPSEEFGRNGPWYNNKCKPCAAEFSRNYARKRKKQKQKMGSWF